MPDPDHRRKGPRAACTRVPAALLCAGLSLLAACATGRPPRPVAAAAHPLLPLPAPVYPATRRGRQLDVYHGVAVADPWRWLEALDTAAVHQWVAAENALSRPYLATLPGREAFKARMRARGEFERFGAALQGGNSYVLPSRRGGRYFFLHSGGLDDQSVLMVGEDLNAPGRVLLDPGALSSDHTVALADFEVAPDGAHVAYATSDGGTDWKTWRVRSVATGQDLAETIRLTKFTSIAWTKDGRGFYYSRYPALPDGSGDAAKPVSVWFHRLEQLPDSDTLVYAPSERACAAHAGCNAYAETSDDGRWLVITLAAGYATNAIAYLDLEDPAARVAPLFDRWDGRYSFVGNDGGELYFLTTAGAPRGRVIAASLPHAVAGEPPTLVAESAESMEDAHYVGGNFIISLLSDAHSRVRVYRADGSARGEVALPGLGQVTGFVGHGADAETFYAYSDFLTPWTIYRYDAITQASTLFRRPTVALDPALYVTEQVFYPSRDGTRIPMYLTHRRDMPRDGQQPTLLYGYGGFNLAQLPAFSVAVASWLDAGGVYALANLRGGGEYGEDWHRAGTKTHKQNVFDDFIAAAEWLIANRVTSPRHLAIQGRSNGGLLVGAALVQRPDLFAVALPVVGVLDMLRYDTASANARQWSSDFGLAENAEEFAALRAYSPVQNVERGICYPPTLITTADRDDRVVPWHSFKFAAALQGAQPKGASCPNPVLLHVETRAGHGAGKPTWMQIEDFADQWSFAAEYVGLRVSAP